MKTIKSKQLVVSSGQLIGNSDGKMPRLRTRILLTANYSLLTVTCSLFTDNCYLFTDKEGLGLYVDTLRE